MTNIYHIQSTGLIHMPGFFAWIMQAVKPFDVAMAARLLDGIGLPQEACLAVMDDQFHWIIEEDGETVRLATYEVN